jgi:uncharacterized membrane protein
VVSFALSWLRSVELQTTTWDMGIYQQALWSTAHGRPFYEAADLETGGYESLLQVHTVFLFYLLAPLYAAFPYEATLFGVQSLVVAAAAIPLFLLGRELTGSPRMGLVSAIAYLAWAPTLSSTLYDFHAEAFLPLELFTIVLLWQRQRYLAGAAVVGVAFATFELAPVLVFFVGVFFLLPSGPTWRGWLVALRTRPRWKALGRQVRGALSSSRVRASVALIVASAAAYFLLLYLQTDVLTSALGMATLPTPATGYVIGGTPTALGLSAANLGVAFAPKLTYWVLILALLGFVPLFAPRALVLSLPWFAFTMMSADPNYAQIGFQYGFIAAASLLPAFAYGLPTVARLLSRLAPIDGAAVPRAPNLGPARGTRPFGRGVYATAATLFAVVLVANIAYSPANPLVQNQGLGSGYRIYFAPYGGFNNVEDLAGLVPRGASVIATDNLFPLIANDENAYSFFWVQNNFLDLPFNTTHLPQFVLIANNRTYAVPSWIEGALYNTSEFGVRGVVWASIVGPVLLFEAHYNGPVATYGPAPETELKDPGSSLANPQAGYVTNVSSNGSRGPASGFSEVAASAPETLGTFFFGPWTALPGGNFTITLTVRSQAVTGAPEPWASESALWVGASGFAQPSYYSQSFDFGALSTTAWTSITFNITLPGPTIQFALQGVVLSTNVQLYLQTLQVTPR